MNRKLFTEEQQQLLRQNPYIYSVTETRITLTKEFKELFMTAYKSGESPRKILEDHGFDINIIGERRIWSISNHIRTEYKKYGNSMRVMVHGAKQPAMMRPQMLPNLYPRLMRSNSSGMK